MADPGGRGQGLTSPVNYEREYLTLKDENTMLKQFMENLRQQLSTAEEALQQAREQYFDVQQKHDSISSQFETLSNNAKSLQDGKMELAQMLERKKEEIARLKETINSIQSFNAQNEATTLNSSQNDIKIKEIEFSFKENRLNNELKMYNDQIQQLTAEVGAKNGELLKLQKETSVSIMQANMKIEQQSNEITSLHNEIGRLKSVNENLEHVNAELSKSYSDLQVNCSNLESTFAKENEAQNELINLLMKNKNDLLNQLAEQAKDNAELRDLVKKGVEAHDALEAEFNAMKESYLNDVTELETERDKLIEELEKSKQVAGEFTRRCIEKEFQKTFPLAFENNRQLSDVVSLADIYNEFVKVKQEKEALAAHNAKLREQMEEMEEKMNEDKPVMFKNIQNFKQMSTAYSALENNLIQMMSEKEKLIAEKDDDNRRIKALEREVKRFEVECNDLSIQIQHLLRSVHQAQGFAVQESSVYSPDSTRQDTSLIPPSLITFKDIQDLQEKNRHLIRLLNQMTEETDQCQPANEDGDLTVELEETRQELDRVKDELKQKSELLERSGQQRRLFSLSGDGSFIDLDPRELVTENKELKEKVERYQQDIENCRQQNLEEVRRLDDVRNGLIAENVNLNADKIKLSADLKMKCTEIENINCTLENYQSENGSLRERNIKLNATVENLEKNIIYVKNELEAEKEKVKLCERNVHLAQSERDLFKNNEASLIQENARIRSELESHKKLVYSLRAIQENCNRSESDTVQSLKMQNDNLQKNNEYYREKLAREEEKWRHSVDEFSSHINSLQMLLDKEKNNSIELQRKYFELQQQCQQREKEAASQVASARGDSHGVLSSEQKRQLANLQDDVKVLKGKLANSEASAENLKMINASLEDNLNRLIQKNQEIQSNIDSQLASKMEEIKRINEELERTRRAYELIVAEKNAAIKQAAAEADANARQIEELKQLLADADAATRKAQANEESMLADLNYQRVIATKAQEDYEAEMALRSTDASTILQLNLELKTVQQSLQEKDAEIGKLSDQINRTTDLWKSQLEALTVESDKLRAERSDLQSVNETLLNQVEQLNNQVIALQNNSNIFALDEANQEESATRLLGVVKFLREEKAQLNLKLAKLSDEHSCIKIQVDNYKKEIDTLKSALEVEKQSTSRLSNLNEFKELLSKAELVPVLTENNSQMRIEINQLELRNRELLEKLAKYENDTKVVNELANKAEGEVVETQFLRKEIESWKAKVHSLTQQLKNFDSDSIKRLMVEKTHLSKQTQALLAEKNKMKQDLESANNKVKTEAEERAKLQTTIAQLRSLARKYRDEIGKIKSDSASTSDREVQVTLESSTAPSAAAAQESNAQLEAFQARLQQLESENQRLAAQIDRINQENEALQKLANEKDEKAKKIAEKAKQRLSESLVEKNSLLREKDALCKEIEKLKATISQLQSNDEQRAQYISQLKSEYNSRISELDRQIEMLTSQLQQPATAAASSSSALSITLVSPAPVTPVVAAPTTNAGSSSSSSSSSASTTMRHPVMPQQQQPPQQITTPTIAVKATPTASIKPLIGERTSTTVRTATPPRTPNSGHRPVTMVQPTANAEDSQISTVPQATVQPSQPPQSVPTSVSSSFPSSIEVSEASTSESQANQFSLGPTTSTGFSGGEEKNKRTFDDDACDEPSTSSSLKKFKSAPMFSTTTTTAGQSDEEAEPDEEAEGELREYEEEQYDEEDGLEVVNEDEEQSGEEHDVEEMEMVNEDDEEEESEGEENDDEEVDLEVMDEDEEEEESEREAEDDSSIEIIEIGDDEDDEEEAAVPNSNVASGEAARDEVSSSASSQNPAGKWLPDDEKQKK